MRRDIFERIIGSNRNLLVNGDISSGKTSNIIFPIIDRTITSDESLLFLDSKEEYINKYYGILKSKDYNIIIINLQELDRSFGWNPLEYPYILYKNNEKDKAIEYLDSIANNIFCENSNDKSFWTQSACDLFIGISLALFEDGTKEEINLNSINNIVNSNNLKEYITKKDKNSIVFTCSSGTVLAPEETSGGILTTFKQQLRKTISKDKLNNLLYKTTFDFNSISKEKNAIFIMNRDDNKEINVIVSIFIEQIFKILFDSPQHPKYNFILDNIDTLNNIDNLSNMLSSGIARNIKFIICTRSLDDFNKKYGEYVDKLSNIININNKNIEVMLNSKYEKIRYFIGPTEFPKDNINYPIITRNTIEIFDLNEFLNNEPESNNQVKEQIEEPKKEFTNNNPFITKEEDNLFSVYEDNKTNLINNDPKDELIQKIDDKINELIARDNEIEEPEIKEETVEEIQTNDNDDETTKEKTTFYMQDDEPEEHEEKKIIKSHKIHKLKSSFENPTEDLLKKIDERLAKLNKEEAEETKEEQEKESKEMTHEEWDKITGEIDELDKDLEHLRSEKSTIDKYPEDEETKEILAKIDKMIAELEKKEDNQVKESNDSTDKFNANIFPNIDNNVFPSINNENEIEDETKKVKNKLNHYNKSNNIEEEIENKLEELGFIKTIDGEKYFMNGYQKKKQELLKEEYNLNEDKHNSIF